MSLFKTREFWTTHSEEKEFFDQNSMIITSLNGESDYIITGSQSGILRIFKPSCEIVENEISGFVPTDLIIEKIFDQPILQLGYGRLVSGSLVYQTAVLNPRILSVHLLKIKEGSATEHSAQNSFQLIYDHHLPRSAANFTIGQFGGSKNRDFMCVQCLDGMLCFFEQENPTFCCFLPNFLLPSPVAYIRKTDSFVTGNGNWCLVSYRYNSLSDSGEQEDIKSNQSKKPIPVWSYNLGESIIEIGVVDDVVNKLNYIMILGDKNLFCLFDSGRLNFMKKLEYSPVTFEVYTINEKIYSLIISETNNLLVYENTTLRWSAKLQFLPICIRRAFLRNFKGVLVFLSEEGRLECSYLGTEPNLFVAPPLVERELDFEKIEEELTGLNKMIRETYGNEIKFANQNPEKEIAIKIQIKPNLEPCKFETNFIQIPNQQMCTVNIEIVPQLAFEEIQISVTVSRPLRVNPSSQFFTTQEKALFFTCHVYLFELYNLSSLFLHVIVTVISSLGAPRSFNKAVMLPLNLVAEGCAPLHEADHKITLNISQTVVPLISLFPEFAENTKSTSGMGFKIFSDAEKSVTVLLAKSSERYRIQASSFASLNLIVEQMIYRLNRHYINVDDFKVFYSSALPSNELIAYVTEHFIKRKEVFELENVLDQLGSQFRIIQKRLISRFKVKNPTPLTNLEILLKDTYSEILKTVEKLQKVNEELNKTQAELTCALNLICNLIKLLPIEEKLKEVWVSVFCPSVEDLDTQNWEDVMDCSLCYLLRTSLAKSEKDKLRISQTNVEKVTDISKMNKHLLQVMERISKVENKLSDQIDDDVTEEEPKTDLEKEEQPVGIQFGESSMRLLSAKKSLLRRRHQHEQLEEK